MKKFVPSLLAIAACCSVGVLAYAAVIFDPESGEGFVGKGDVQLTFDWNNKDLQDYASAVRFRSASDVVTEVSWICTNSNNQNTQERARTTTTTTEGLVESVARTRNQVTGFNLLGYDGDPETSVATEGPPVNSCPGGSNWSLTTPAGDPEIIEEESGEYFEVSKDYGVTWDELLETP